MIIIGGGIWSIMFMILGLIVYIFNLIGDIASVIIRIIILSDCSQDSCTSDNIEFARTQLAFTLIFLLLDIFAIVTVSYVLQASSEFIYDVRQWLLQICGSNEKMIAFYQVPRRAHYMRNVIAVVYQVEFWTVIIFLILIALGFGSNVSFQYLALFAIPHYFLWTTGRAVSGIPGAVPSDAIYRTDQIFAIGVFYVIAMATDIAGIVYGIVESSVCLTPSGTCNNTEIFFIYVIIFLFVAMFAEAALQAVAIYTIYEELVTHAINYRLILARLMQKQEQLVQASRKRRDEQIEYQRAVQERTIYQKNVEE